MPKRAARPHPWWTSTCKGQLVLPGTMRLRPIVFQRAEIASVDPSVQATRSFLVREVSTRTLLRLLRIETVALYSHRCETDAPPTNRRHVMGVFGVKLPLLNPQTLMLATTGRWKSNIE